MSEPAAGPTEVLQGQVRVWRDRRKLSAQGLADRIADIGGSLSRVAISKIENGDRGVTVDEWLQLAHALAVPPPLLFLDLEAGTYVRVAPAVEIHPWLAWEWVVGNEPPIMSDRTVTRVEEFGRARTAITLYREERAAAAAVHDAASAIRAAEYAGDEAAVRGARTAHVEALRELARCLDAMVENDIHPPAKPRDWVDTMQSLKLLRYRVPVMEEVTDGERQ